MRPEWVGLPRPVRPPYQAFAFGDLAGFFAAGFLAAPAFALVDFAADGFFAAGLAFGDFAADGFFVLLDGLFADEVLVTIPWTPGWTNRAPHLVSGFTSAPKPAKQQKEHSRQID